MSAMLLALSFPRAERASTFEISAERNVWLQSALRSFAIVCDHMETSLDTFYESFFISYAKSTKLYFRTQTSHQRSVAFSHEILNFARSGLLLRSYKETS